MNDLAFLIRICIALKQGNKEFALFGYDDGSWGAEIGNPSASYVRLGEENGEYCGKGETPEAAVEALILELKKAQK